MKKAKIMLMTLAVFAVLGAALAFKAKTFNAAFCTKTFVAGGPATSICDLTTTLPNRVVVAGTPTIYATSLDKDGDPITTTTQCEEAQLPCPAVRLIAD